MGSAPASSRARSSSRASSSSRPVLAAVGDARDQAGQQALARIEIGAQVHALTHAHLFELADRASPPHRRPPCRASPTRRPTPAASRECVSACGSRNRSPGVSSPAIRPRRRACRHRARQRLRELLVQLDLRRRILPQLQRHRDLDAPARELFLDQRAQPRLEIGDRPAAAAAAGPGSDDSPIESSRQSRRARRRASATQSPSCS